LSEFFAEPRAGGAAPQVFFDLLLLMIGQGRLLILGEAASHVCTLHHEEPYGHALRPVKLH
jgi:hypothetical protein